MRLFTLLSRGLLAAALLAGAALGMTACGPNYAIFKVDITSTTSPRNNIELCTMTITDENNVLVLDNYQLASELGTNPDGTYYAKQGCAAGLTPAHVGVFSYSSSRTSGSLTFVVNALDNDSAVVQTGRSTANVSAYPPEVSVPLTISKP